MTDLQKNQQEKGELYIDHYDGISELRAAFDQRWSRFSQNWGTELAQSLDSAELVTDTDAPELYQVVDITLSNGSQRRWTFRQGHSDWSWMFPREWWTTLDDGASIFDPSNPQARVGFLHRLDGNQKSALANHELTVYLRNAPSGHRGFYGKFADRFNADDEIPELLPSSTTRPGVKSNVLEATYDINVEVHGGFFEAYVDALSRALTEHVIANPALVDTIDQIYHEVAEEENSF